MSDAAPPAAINTDVAADAAVAAPADADAASPPPPPLTISLSVSPTNKDRRVGEVIRIVSRKFGFIRLDNEPNIFFHFKDLPEDAMGEIAVNTKVEFTMVENPWEKGKMKAVDIVVLERAPTVSEQRAQSTGGAAAPRENSWTQKYGSWRVLFEALANAITNVEGRNDALKAFISATQFSAQEDGVSLLRSIQHADRLGLVKPESAQTCRALNGIGAFQQLVVERWGTGDSDRGAKGVLKDMEFTIWRLSEERRQNESHQWMTYCTLMAFCCTLAAIWEMDLTPFDDACNITAPDPSPGNSSWQRGNNRGGEGNRPRGNSFDRPDRGNRPRGNSFDRSDIVQGANRGGNTKDEGSWRSPPGSPANRPAPGPITVNVKLSPPSSPSNRPDSASRSPVMRGAQGSPRSGGFGAAASSPRSRSDSDGNWRRSPPSSPSHGPASPSVRGHEIDKRMMNSPRAQCMMPPRTRGAAWSPSSPMSRAHTKDSFVFSPRLSAATPGADLSGKLDEGATADVISAMPDLSI